VRPLTVTLGALVVAAGLVVGLGMAQAEATGADSNAATSATDSQANGQAKDQAKDIEGSTYRKAFRVNGCTVTASGAVNLTAINERVGVWSKTEVPDVTADGQCANSRQMSSWVSLQCTSKNRAGRAESHTTGWLRSDEAAGTRSAAQLSLPSDAIAVDCKALHGLTTAGSTSRPARPIVQELTYRVAL
jgi:hypothetical protein